MGYKHTCDTIYTSLFQGITNNIYAFGRRFYAPSFFYPFTHISTRPYSFLPVQMTGGVSLSLHKAMLGIPAQPVKLHVRVNTPLCASYRCSFCCCSVARANYASRNGMVHKQLNKRRRSHGN